MFKNLLVAVDGSAASERIVHLAMSLVRSSAGELHLVRVIDEDATFEQVDDAVRSMASINTSLLMGGITADIRISRGHAVDQIIREVDMVNADVVIMATSGHSGLTHGLLGSTTDQVFARATVPVMAVSPHAHMDGNIRSILVPRDSSLGSAQALSAAKAFAQATGAQIELLHVVEPLVRYFRGRYIEPGFEEQMRDKSGQEMKRLAARLRERGFKADGRAVIGQPAATIVTVADEINADLIVMTTTGLTGLTSKILGSVTHEVLRTAHSPLLLLHFNSTEGLTAIREDAEADARRASESNDGVGVSSSAATSPATLAHVPPQ